MTHWMVVIVLFSERASTKGAKPSSLSRFEPSLYVEINYIYSSITLCMDHGISYAALIIMLKLTISWLHECPSLVFLPGGQQLAG